MSKIALKYYSDDALQVLLCLSSVKDLAEFLNISEKTLRTRITESKLSTSYEDYLKIILPVV